MADLIKLQVVLYLWWQREDPVGKYNIYQKFTQVYSGHIFSQPASRSKLVYYYLVD